MPRILLGHTITGELSEGVSGSYNHRKAVAGAPRQHDAPLCHELLCRERSLPPRTRKERSAFHSDHATCPGNMADVELNHTGSETHTTRAITSFVVARVDEGWRRRLASVVVQKRVWGDQWRYPRTGLAENSCKTVPQCTSLLCGAETPASQTLVRNSWRAVRY